MKINDVIKILKNTIETFLEDEEMLYSKILANQKLSPSRIFYWRNKDERIQPLIDELKELQEIKILSALVNSNSKNITGLIFYSKTKLKMIEYERELQLELEKSKINNINNISDMKIEINYSTIPSRSDIEIAEIIEGKDDSHNE